MNIEKLKKIPTVELITVLNNALDEDEQDIANIIAYELACRIYVPNHTEPFEDLLYKLGYREIEEKQKKR